MGTITVTSKVIENDITILLKNDISATEPNILVKGILVDEHNQPLQCQQVTLTTMNEDIPKTLNFSTDSNGYFVKYGMTKGLFKLHINSSSWDDAVIHVTPNDDLIICDLGTIVIQDTIKTETHPR
jgi:hypothetical protein